MQVPAPLINEYRRQAKKAVLRLSNTFEKEILDFYNQPLAKEYFAQDANIAAQLALLLESLKKRTLKSFLGSLLGSFKSILSRSQRETKAYIRNAFTSNGTQFAITSPPDMPKGMEEVVRASLEENASLIRNIYDNYVGKISGELMRTVTTGESNFQRLKSMVAQCRDVALHRAENVAMDQTRKAYQTISRVRMEAAGIKKGVWIHTGGTTHPRKNHQDFDGKVFDLKEGAPIGHFDGRTDAPTYPSLEPFCRCTYRPVIEWD